MYIRSDSFPESPNSLENKQTNKQKLLLYLRKEPLMEQNFSSMLALKWKQMAYVVAESNRRGKPDKVRSEIKVWIVNGVNRNI